MVVPKEQTDEELMSLLKQGQIIAFEEIYSRYWDQLLNAAYKRVRVLELCEELVQDTFAKLWEKRSTISLTTGLSNYLHTAIKYGVIDHYRKELVKKDFISSASRKSELDFSTEENIFLKDLTQHLEKLIDQLPPKCKQVYVLSRIEHKNNKEIALLLNISEKTVEGHITKALQVLRGGITQVLLLSFLFMGK